MQFAEIIYPGNIINGRRFLTACYFPDGAQPLACKPPYRGRRLMLADFTIDDDTTGRTIRWSVLGPNACPIRGKWAAKLAWY
jgi:hypothetical protein